jgi:hypothetical protein
MPHLNRAGRWLSPRAGRYCFRVSFQGRNRGADLCWQIFRGIVRSLRMPEGLASERGQDALTSAIVYRKSRYQPRILFVCLLLNPIPDSKCRGKTFQLEEGNEMARVSIFRCDTEPDLYGYTAERTGKALLRARRELGWSYVKDSEVFPEDGHTAVDVTDMLYSLNRQGYYLFSADPRGASLSRGAGAAGSPEGRTSWTESDSAATPKAGGSR